MLAIYDKALNSAEIEHNFNQSTELIKAPGELTGEAGFKKVELAWKDSSNNEDGFIIERQNIGEITSLLNQWIQLLQM